MALALEINFMGGVFGTKVAPGANSLIVRCLIVRCKIVTKDKAVPTDLELTAAIEMLRAIIPDYELERLAPTGPATIYTTTITIWMLILQRLGKGKTLNGVVKDVLAQNRQLLPDNKRVREATLSEKSGDYSDARKRLPLKVVEYFAKRVCESFIQQTPSWFGNRRAFIIDGTTMTLSPTSKLREAFPPATNQHGETVWPVMLMLVAHELQSGAALPPELGAMYGDGNTSEAKLAAKLATRIPLGSVVFADSGFGIFSVAYAMTGAGHQILFRLTKSRFKSMRRQAAGVAGLPPRRLSFKEVWNTFQSFLLNQPPCSAPEWQARYRDALRIAPKDKLPDRPGRSYKRKAHPRRQKSTKFMKSETKNETLIPPQMPN